MSNEMKKRVKRALIEKDVKINNIIKGQVLDISIDGMYIYTQASFIPGTIFEMSFKIAEETIRTMAKVQHAQPNVGIGVQFVDLSKENIEKIREYVES